MVKIFRAAATLGVAACVAGCSVKQMTVDQTAKILLDAGRVFDRETDPEMAAAAIPASLKTIEGFLEASPEQPVLLRLLAEGYVNYGFGFVEDEAERVFTSDLDRAEHLRSRALDYYLRAWGFALRLLRGDRPELAAALARGREPSAAALAALTRDDVPALFWTANAWAAAINVGKSDPELLSRLSIARALLERCVELDESFFHAGPRMAMGALEASLPVALGGNPEAAQRQFGRAIELTGGRFLMARVLQAKLVGLQVGDRNLFETGLRDVLDADPDADPALALANRLAQRRARRYLQNASDYFLD